MSRHNQQPFGKISKLRRRRQTAALKMEALEDRRFMAADVITVTYDNGALYVDGTDGDDSIAIVYEDGRLSVIEPEVVDEFGDIVKPAGPKIAFLNEFGELVDSIDVGLLNHIEAKGYGGNDRIEIRELEGVFERGAILRGGAGNDTLIGGGGGDSLKGDGGSDTLFGGGGSDDLLGGKGIDFLYGGAGNDNLGGEDGNDYLDGGEGDDWLSGGSGSDRIHGGAGLDGIGESFLLTADLYDDRLESTTRDQRALVVDQLTGIERADLNGDWYAGNKDDFLLGGDVGGVRLNASNFSGDVNLYGSIGGDVLIGGAGNDVIYAWAGNDYLEGGGGADLLNGYTGNDTFSGGLDVDRIDGGADYDTIVEGDFTHALLTDTSLQSLRLTQFQIVTDTLEGIEQASLFAVDSGLGTAVLDARGFSGATSLFGSNQNDLLYGGSGVDYIYGFDGADTIDGGAGGDFLYGMEGNDTLTGGRGADLIDGGADRDTLVEKDLTNATMSDTSFRAWVTRFVPIPTDTLREIESADLSVAAGRASNIDASAFSGETRMQGSNQRDVLRGGRGKNTIYGNDGNDEIWGGDSRDWLYGEGGPDTIHGLGGGDSIFGGIDNDALYGDGGNDELFGEAGRDWIEGGADNDRIDGGADSDFGLVGGTGRDLIYGGAGEDNLYGMEDTDTLIGGTGRDGLDGGGYFAVDRIYYESNDLVMAQEIDYLHYWSPYRTGAEWDAFFQNKLESHRRQFAS